MRLHQILLPFALSGAVLAQFPPGLTLPPSGGNQKAAVTQYIGPVKVTIEYSSPAVHAPGGKDRRGEIWGKLVPYGLADIGPFGNQKPDPWRAGANENTVFEVSHPVLIEGQKLPAGRYGVHMIPGQEEWTVIFSKNSKSWGSFFYDAAEDALRVTVKPHKHEYREWLTYEFPLRRPSEATAELQWEELALPWNIKVENVNQIYLTNLRQELGSVPGFSWQGYLTAAQFCLNQNVDLEQGLQWADASISRPFIGDKNFNTMSVKAQILAKMGKEQESADLMQEALKLPGTNKLEIHQYGRQLLAAKKTKEAMAVFQYNVERNGEAWPTHVGLARGYAAMGDSKQALEHAKKALAQAPDDLNKKSLEAMVEALESGQPIAN